MSCILVDGGGTGRVWRMESERSAYDHVLYTPGDVVCSQETHVLDRWGQWDLPMVARIAGDQRAVAWVEEQAQLLRTDGPARAEAASRIWPALLAVAVEPPSEDSELAAELLRSRRRQAQESRAMTDTAPKAAAKAKDTKDATPKEKMVAGRPGTSVLRFGKDKEGKPFGPSNNPKREGSATYGRFAKYRDGMTINQALEAGLTEADVGHDMKKGFVVAT